MIYLDYPNKDRIAGTHFNAIKTYIQTKSDETIDELHECIRGLFVDLPERRDKTDYSWLRRFILAPPEQIDFWVKEHPDKLQFDFFLKLYSSRFSKSPSAFVDADGTYNAYTMLAAIDFHICPYCDESYLDIVESNGQKRRTFDVDHFHPKNKNDYPALAMCFYNLIPSCKACNSIKNAGDISANPYRTEIEEWSHFVPANPGVFIGRILESLQDDELVVRMHAIEGMIANKNMFGLEERYNNRKDELRRILILSRALRPENIEEKKRLGLTDVTLEIVYGKPYPQERGKLPHQKIRHDLTGY